MKTVLFCKTVDLNEVCMDYTCNSLKDLITTSEDGFNLVLSIDSQKLFRFGMYHYDSEDGYCEQSLNKFWSLLEELGASSSFCTSCTSGSSVVDNGCASSSGPPVSVY